MTLSAAQLSAGLEMLFGKMAAQTGPLDMAALVRDCRAVVGPRLARQGYCRVVNIRINGLYYDLDATFRGARTPPELELRCWPQERGDLMCVCRNTFERARGHFGPRLIEAEQQLMAATAGPTAR